MGYRIHHGLPDSALTAVLVVNCVPAVGLFYFDLSVVGLAVFYFGDASRRPFDRYRRWLSH